MDGLSLLLPELHFLKTEAAENGKMLAFLEIRSELAMTSYILKELVLKIKSQKSLGGITERIAPLEELFILADHMKTLQFGFEMLPGDNVYQVTVKYRGANIGSSPLRLSLSGLSPPLTLAETGEDFEPKVERLSGGKEQKLELSPPPLTLEKTLTPGVDLTAKKSWTVLASVKSTDLHKPWGGCVLANGNFVVSTVAAQLKMYDQNLMFIKDIKCQEGNGFDSPADMTALRNGNFAIKDKTGIRVLDPEGDFVSRIYNSRFCFGIAEDDENRVWFIETVKKDGKIVGMLKCYDLNKSQIVPRAISLQSVIGQLTGSKCRFLTFSRGRLYITDLGLDRIYVLNVKSLNVRLVKAEDRVKETESWSGCEVDSAGNILLADYKNDRLCLFDKKGNWLKQVSAGRPSNVVLDREKGQLYVLNLRGSQAVRKYSLTK